MSYFVAPPARFSCFVRGRTKSRQSFGLDGYFGLIYTLNLRPTSLPRHQAPFSFSAQVPEPQDITAFYTSLGKWLSKDGRFDQMVKLLDSDERLGGYVFEYAFDNGEANGAKSLAEAPDVKNAKDPITRVHNLIEHCLKYVSKPGKKIQVAGRQLEIDCEAELLKFLAHESGATHLLKKISALPLDPPGWRPKKVLFVGAVPDEEFSAGLTREFKKVEQIRVQVPHDMTWELKSDLSVSQDLLKNLLKGGERYDMIHFCCHGELHNQVLCLVLCDNKGNREYVPLPELMKLLDEHQSQCRLVLFTACETAKIGAFLTSQNRSIIGCTGDGKSNGTAVNRCIGFVGRFYEALYSENPKLRATSFCRCYESACREAGTDADGYGKLEFFPRTASQHQEGVKDKNGAQLAKKTDESFDDFVRRVLPWYAGAADDLSKEERIRKVHRRLDKLKSSEAGFYKSFPEKLDVVLEHLAYETLGSHAISCVWESFQKVWEAIACYQMETTPETGSKSANHKDPAECKANLVGKIELALGQIRDEVMLIPVPGLKATRQEDNYEVRLCFMDKASSTLASLVPVPWLRGYWGLQLLHSSNQSGRWSDDLILVKNHLDRLKDILTQPFKRWHEEHAADWNDPKNGYFQTHSPKSRVLDHVIRDYKSQRPKLFRIIQAANQ